MTDLPIVERVLQAVEARLAAITLDGLVTDRNRWDAVADDLALVLQDGEQQHGEEQTVFVQNFRTIAVEGFVKVDRKDDLGPKINTLWAELVKSVTGDVSLGGLAIEITLGEYTSRMAPPAEEESRWSGEFSQSFTILYATKQGDPYSLAP